MHFSLNEKKRNDETPCCIFSLFLMNYIHAVVNSPRFNIGRTRDTRVSTHYVTAIIRGSRMIE